MAVLVQKFGGTSVETPQRLLDVAGRILEEKGRGWQILVVVSAMGQTTDELLALARQVSPHPPRREIDMLLTAGERISMALLAMALETRGIDAISFTGSQSGIITDGLHSDARIVEMRPTRIEEALAAGRVVIVAGFQGVSRQKEITTLGRGGSDTTAVALAVHFGSPWCEIFTDVYGVLSADPRLVPRARTIGRIGYHATIVLSHLGAQVLFRRAVILARKYRMPLRVRCALADGAETWILPPDAEVTMPTPSDPSIPRPPLESDSLLSVALERSCALVELESEGDPATLLRLLDEEEVRGAWSWVETERRAASWVVRAVLPETPERCQAIASLADRPGVRLRLTRELALVSLVGEGILDRPGLLADAHACLAAEAIGAEAARSSHLSLSFLVPRAAGGAAVRVLHDRFVAGA
jgi:aspartate kinase